MSKLIYFFGLDNSNCIIPRECTNQKVAKTPIQIRDTFSNICVGVDLFVYQKVGSDKTWFIQGQGITSESEIFASNAEISQVCFGSNILVGLSLKLMSLYRIEFNLNFESQTLSWTQKAVAKLDPAIIFKGIITNSNKVFVLDDRSSIYKINEGITLKWRLEGVNVVKLATGFGHFVALSDTGALYSWGSGSRGELGHFEHDHVMVDCEVPKRVEFFDDLTCTVKDICCGGWHTLALTSDGDVYSWGWNESGQLGHSGKKLSAVGGVPFPIDLGSADDPITQIACGARHSLAVLKSGEIYSWGLNKHGQLGVGDLENRMEPTKISTDISSKSVKVECGRWSTFLHCS